MMDRVAREMESYLWQRSGHGQLVEVPSFDLKAGGKPLSKAVGTAVAALSRDLLVRAVVVVSRGRGTSATTLSSARPAAPLVAVSRKARVIGWMSLLWGVLPYQVGSEQLEHPQELARRLALELGLAKPESYVLEVGGFSRDPRRNVPSISVVRV